MEHLGYLRKLYEYGETLLADELNEIVLYINTSIETINILIDREYAINNGHCEVRYKNSAQLPTKPATGSSGYSDGWSSNYTAPDTEHGEITWMSICFLNGNGEYGVWSSPVRITWGTTSGGGSGGGSGEGSSQGRDGEPGAFKSRVFKRQNTKPARPVGGSYTVPIPPGWYDGIPQGLAIIWSSVCTFYGDGTSSGWSDPALESDTANLDVEFSPRRDQPDPPYGNTPFSNHEAEGWYDPNSSNFNTAGEMRWRAERKVSNGVYDGPWVISCIVGEGGEQGPPGKTGGHHETRYKNHLITSANPIPVKPATGTDGTQNGWSVTLPSLSSQDLLNDIVTFMTQCFVNEDGEYGEWTTPMRITGTNGKDGALGSYEIKLYSRSAYATSSSGSSMPADCSDNDWTTIPPIPKTAKPYIWQRSRMYNPATDTYTDWVYVRLTGEIGAHGSAGLTGLWYNYAGVWGQDISSVKNTDRIGYYVQTSGGDFYMNTAPSGQANNNTPGGANWEKMQSDFKYIISEALFADEAYLGSFVINHDWFISKEGKLGGSWSNNYSSFSPSGFPNSGFIPNVAIDAKTGKVYFNDAHVEGYISATSGRIGNWTINNYGTGGISAEVDANGSLPYIYLRLRTTGKMAMIGNYAESSDPTMILGSYPGGKSIWAKGLGTSSSRGVGLYANAIYPSSGEKGSDAIYALAFGSDCTAISAYGLLGAKALEVSGGDTVIGGSGLFSVGCAIKTSSFTLPSNPRTGTIFLCKGSNLTVTTSNHKVTEGSDGSVLIASGGASHNFNSTTFILFFIGSEWALLYSN